MKPESADTTAPADDAAQTRARTPATSDATARPVTPSRPKWLNALLLLVAAAFGWTLCMRGLILSDEGYLLLQAWDLLEGRVIYRDMDSFVTPGIWFLLAGTFATLGPSVFASRLLAFACWLMLIVCTERVTTRHVSPAAGLVGAACMVLFTVWAFPAWTFAFYSPFSVLFALLALERLLAWWHGAPVHALFVCGVWLGLSIVFKQNYGVFALLGASVGFGLMCLERRRETGIDARGVFIPMAWTAGGVVMAGLPVLLYLLANGAMGDAWQSLVVHPFEFAGAHDIPVAPFSLIFDPDVYTSAVDRLTYLSAAQLSTTPIAFLHDFRGAHRLHVLLYWLPLAIFASGALLAVRWRERSIDPVLGTVVCVCGAVHLGLFPRADFNHLVNVYQPVIVAGVFIAAEGRRRIAGRSVLVGRVCAVGLATLVLTYGVVALIWWNDLRTRLVVEVPGARGGVKISYRNAENLTHMMRAIDTHTRRGEALLTVPDLAMLNFLTDRPMPSAYYNLYEHHIAFDGGRSVVEGAERNGVRVALTRYNNFFSDRRGLADYAPELAHYLRTRFRRSVLGGSDGYVLLEKRFRPAPDTPFVDGLAMCDLEGTSANEVEVRRHLLFSALYHKSPRGKGMRKEGLVTRCRIDVPDAVSELSLEFGYRRPTHTTPGTALEAAISIDHGGNEVEVGRHHFTVQTDELQRPQIPYQKLEIDLTPWAGQPVDIVFRTRLEGRVQVHPLDYKGFAQVYRDVRMTQAEGATR